VALAADAAWNLVRDRLERSGRAATVRPATAVLVVVLVAAALVPAAGRYESVSAADDRWGREIIEATFAAVEPDAVIISWWSFSTPLWYAQHVEGKRPDVTVLDDRDILDEGYGDVPGAVEAHLGRRPVYLIRTDEDLARLAPRLELEAVPDVPLSLYRVLGTTDAPSAPLGWADG
jgi:hypothetical protein